MLVRDHGSDHDVALGDDDVIDLAEGNVFVSMPRCEYQPRGGCTGAVKLAWFIDDQPEVTLRSEQTGRTLRELFGLTVAVRLFRDLESSHDESVGLDAVLRFPDGPVFYSRRASVGLTITVNKQTFPGVMLDGAYLPQGSPLLGRVAGAAGQGVIQADGRMWELVSYHPHNGGGGPTWNPNRHGVHSYYSEVLAWIHRAN